MKPSFIIGRAMLAVVLMIGFYILALGIASGLLWVPFAEFVYAHRITPKLAMICILGATVPTRPSRIASPRSRTCLKVRACP